MKKHHLAPCLVTLILISTLGLPHTLADTIAYTSFEEPGTGDRYTDTGDPATDHPLVNNAGEAPVNYTSTGGELGFSSHYFNTRDGERLTDGDYVGVTDYTGVVGSFPDGSQGFQISDPDGAMRTTLDTVDLTGYLTPTVSIQYFVQETGWEAEDALRIWVEADGGTEIDLLNTTGSDIDDLGIEGSWRTVSETLTGYVTATLSFELDANAAEEAVYFDDVRFTGTSTVDNPPRVASSEPADGATGVSLDATITLTFDEPVDLAADALALECPAGTAQTFSATPALPAADTISVTLSPQASLPPGVTCVVTGTAAAILDRDGTPDPLDGNGDGTGGDDYVLSFATINCGGAATLIHDIQGSGMSSPEEVHTP